jgi:hypothetical protein
MSKKFLLNASRPLAFQRCQNNELCTAVMYFEFLITRNTKSITSAQAQGNGTHKEAQRSHNPRIGNE